MEIGKDFLRKLGLELDFEDRGRMEKRKGIFFKDFIYSFESKREKE